MQAWGWLPDPGTQCCHRKSLSPFFSHSPLLLSAFSSSSSTSPSSSTSSFFLVFLFSLSLSYVFCVTFPLGHVSPKYVAKLAQLYLRLRFYQFTNPIAGKWFFPPPPKAPTTLLDMNVLDWLLTKMRNRSHRQITDAYYLPIDRRPCNLLSKTWLDTKGVLWIIMPGQKCKQRLS